MSVSRVRLLNIAIVALLAPLAASQIGGTSVAGKLQISAVANVQITLRDTDEILNGASRILKQCDFEISRIGVIESLPDPPRGSTILAGIVDSPTAYRYYIGQPGYVKLVTEISWCGRPGDLPLPQPVPGCAAIGFPAMLVARQENWKLFESWVWAHEYAHTRGLAHVRPEDDPKSFFFNLMRPELIYVNGQDTLAPNQCEALRLGPQGVQTPGQNRTP